uniref:Uncharacterized protein n=1 Tax=Tanacetum cinerariifolium TaxID=118510 RepID=A0A699HLK5_TANCI|nr:hypothetical protein [Tanacetum cinerariifolium]
MDGRRRYWKPLEDHGRLEALRNPRSFYPWKIIEYSSNVDLVETKCHMEDHCRYNSVTSGIRVSQFEAMENEGDKNVVGASGIVVDENCGREESR